MMVGNTHALIQKMEEFGLPPPRGTFRRIATMPDMRRRATELRRALNRLPGVIPW
jgi:hypothetical protein